MREATWLRAAAGYWFALVLAGAVLAVAAAWVIASIVVILDFGLRYPAFDQFHFYPKYLGMPFPDAVFELENGHRPVLPSLVRIAEVAWTGAGQMMQIGVGLACALLTGALVALAGRRDGRSVLQAVTAWLLVALGLLWLGNARMLIHGNEILAVHLVTVFTVAALWSVHAATGAHALRWMLVAGVCALGAVFSFGSGMSAFPALFVAAFVARVRWRAWIAPALLFAGALGLYAAAMPGDAGVRDSLLLSPLENLGIGLEWLSAPWMHAWLRYGEPSPFAWAPTQDPGNAIEVGLRASATFLQTILGVHASRIAGFVIGACGLLAWLACLRHAWRQAGKLPRGRLVALGVATFGLAVGATICLARLGHFRDHPADVLAERYLPWSCLFWLGIALYALAASKASSRRRDVAGAVLAIGLAVMLYPSQHWWAGWAGAVHRGNQASAVAAQMGIWDPARFPDGLDASKANVLDTLALLREQRLSMFGEAGYALWSSAWQPPETLMPPQAGTWWRIGEGLDDDVGHRHVRIEGMLPTGSSLPRDMLIVFVDAGRSLRGMAKPGFVDFEPYVLGLLPRARRGFDGYLLDPRPGEALDLLLVDPATRAVVARFPLPEPTPP